MPSGEDLEHGDVPSEKTPLLRRYSTEKVPSYWDMLFGRDKNKTFGDNAELAARGAVAVTLSALPFVFPGQFPTLIHEMKEVGIMTPFVIMMLVFTLYKTVGETVYLAWCGMLGTFLATAAIWGMFGVYPHGYAGHTGMAPVFFGCTCGFFFYWSTLFFNFDMNTRIFALSNFCWFLMSFLDPHEDDFNKNFSVKLGGTALNGMATAGMGCFFAILASLLPYPMSALTQAKTTARELIDIQCNVWVSASECFLADSYDEVLFDRLISDLACMNARLSRLDAMITASWWECFGLGRTGKMRRGMRHIHLLLSVNSDRLQSVLHACSADFNEEHNSITVGVKDSLTQLLQDCHECLASVSDAALNFGWMTSEQQRVDNARSLEEVVNSTKKYTIQLTADFHNVKKDRKLPRISESILDENTFLYNACAFGRACHAFAEDILKDIRGDESLTHIQRTSGFAEVFSKNIILSDDNLTFCGRQLASQLSLFGLGYVGIRGGAINPYNAALASNAAVLMSQSVGPEMKRNMERVQGIVFGTVVGHLVFSIFGGCELWNLVSICILTLSWTWVCLFTYFDSVKYGSMGCLMAVFGPMAFLQPCDSHVALHEKIDGKWHAVIDVVFTVLVISTVDMLSAQGRPSVMAGEALTKSWRHMLKVLKDLFDPKVTELQYTRAATVALLSRARALGKQAKEEPRFWRAPFEDDIFDACLSTLEEMRTITSGLEFSIAEKTAAADRHLGAKKKQVMLKLLQEEAFQKFASVFLDRMDRFAQHLEIFEEDKPVEAGKLFRTSTKNLKEDLHDARVKMFEEVNKPTGIFGGSPREAECSLEQGAAAQVSVVIDSVDLLAEKIMTLQRMFVQH
eukprot:TRINITY_DN75796_c0_g1_i1.p1 TRINITY_DN75796_c0_g1~~TRINITY_DN75796_c0_g1_i1.p1  ORF type:complete len:856 (-),score=256.87 TRINITY_DN75796_c0_g1_i1:132-2699(-)